MIRILRNTILALMSVLLILVPFLMTRIPRHGMPEACYMRDAELMLAAGMAPESMVLRTFSFVPLGYTCIYSDKEHYSPLVVTPDFTLTIPFLVGIFLLTTLIIASAIRLLSPSVKKEDTV